MFSLRLEEGRGENYPPFLTKAKTTGNTIYLKLTVLQGMLDWLMVSDIILVSFSAAEKDQIGRNSVGSGASRAHSPLYYLSWERGWNFSSPLGSQILEHYWSLNRSDVGILYDDRYHPADTYELQCKPFSGVRQGSLIPEALRLRLARLPHKYQYWELQWKDVQHSGKLGFPTAQQTGWQEASHTETCLQDVTRCWLKYSGDNF